MKTTIKRPKLKIYVSIDTPEYSTSFSANTFDRAIQDLESEQENWETK